MYIYVAEFIGTALLVLLGNGVVANNLLVKNKGYQEGFLHINLGWGLAVFIAVLSVGWISGAHINPAVTIALFSIGKIQGSLVLGYITAQVLGGILGSVLVFLTYKKHYEATENPEAILATFSTGPAIANSRWNLVTEVIGTFVLVTGILAFSAPANDVMMMGPLFVGLLVLAIGVSLGGPTGYAINPARDLGPRIAHMLLPIANKGSGNWSYAWVPIVGPIIGGLLGAMLYKVYFAMLIG